MKEFQVSKEQEKKGTFSFALSDGTVVTLNIPTSYDLFTGVAPGIPPKGLKPGENVYPLIVRMEGKDFDIEATWKFVK